MGLDFKDFDRPLIAHLVDPFKNKYVLVVSAGKYLLDYSLTTYNGMGVSIDNLCKHGTTYPRRRKSDGWRRDVVRWLENDVVWKVAYYESEEDF